MSEEKSSYRQIMKATSVFGGAQVFQIIIGIVRSKFIAVFLGPLGMGISGLLSSTTGIIGGLTNFGLSTSAVKDIAAAHGSGDISRLAMVAAVFKRLVWISGLLGMLLMIVLSPWLSQLTFGNKEYTLAFVFISCTLLLNQISAGQGVILRGTRQISYMIQSGMIGSILGLITTLPLYYFYGISGIVPGIIIASVTSLLLTWYFSKKVSIPSIRVSKATTILEGKGMVKMGFMISLSGLIMQGAGYIDRIFISHFGGIDQVGLFSAGFAIINTYVGMVFTAMSADYYPRLSAVSHSNEESTKVVNQQAELAILILAPIILVFLVYIHWVVVLFYSNKFTPINDMILYAAFGMLFKAASWAVAFLFLAKSDSKLYFRNELVTIIYTILLNMFFYYNWGLKGMGISFLIVYILYLFQVYYLTHKKYEFSFNKSFYRVFTIQLLIAILCLLVVELLSSPYTYVFGSLLIFVSAWYSYAELDKRIDIKSMIKSIKNKF